MESSITQRAIKIGRKEQIQVEKGGNIKTDEDFWQHLIQTVILLCHHIIATRQGAAVIAQNSSVFPLFQLQASGSTDIAPNILSIFLQYFPHISTFNSGPNQY